MRAAVGVHYVEHGAGTPVLVLHGANVDHREAEACFDPGLEAVGGLRRIYPDLPGMGRTPAPPSVRCADDVADVLTRFAEEIAGGDPVLVAGHSAGAYFATGMASRRPELIGALALVCPLLPEAREVPAHRPVIADPDLGDEGFRDYFVMQTPAMLDRYRRHVEPAAALVDDDAMARIGEHWVLQLSDRAAYGGPVLVVAGRRDATAGWRAAAELADRYAGTTTVVVEDAGHALPHEKPELLAALLADWVQRYREQRPNA